MRSSAATEIHPTQRRISRNILRLLLDREMGRDELARRIGFSSKAILDQRLNGRSEWKPQQLEDVAGALGVSVGDLYGELRLVPQSGPAGGGQNLKVLTGIPFWAAHSLAA